MLENALIDMQPYSVWVLCFCSKRLQPRWWWNYNDASHRRKRRNLNSVKNLCKDKHLNFVNRPRMIHQKRISKGRPYEIDHYIASTCRFDGTTRQVWYSTVCDDLYSSVWKKPIVCSFLTYSPQLPIWWIPTIFSLSPPNIRPERSWQKVPSYLLKSTSRNP